jgi:molybdopterin/thiamine biosynthesis adenylyltransferase
MTVTPQTNPAVWLDRDIRQRQIVPPEKLAVCHATIIGVGAIGRQVALQLAAVGIAAMELIDHDIVGVENLAPQAYWPGDIGTPKVEATASLCHDINPEVQVNCCADRFRRSSVKTLQGLAGGRQPVVFCCVDSIDTRRLIWETLHDRICFWADGRMAAEVIRVLASDAPVSDHFYPSTLFTEAEAYGGSCTAKSTVYTASIAAGLMLGQFTRWLRGMPVDCDVSLNLLSMELAVS